MTVTNLKKTRITRGHHKAMYWQIAEFLFKLMFDMQRDLQFCSIWGIQPKHCVAGSPCLTSPGAWGGWRYGGTRWVMGLDLDCAADLQVAQGVHDGVLDDTTDRPAMPYEMDSRVLGRSSPAHALVRPQGCWQRKVTLRSAHGALLVPGPGPHPSAHPSAHSGGGTYHSLIRLHPALPVCVSGCKQVTKRSTHARPGMHMQQCSAVPSRWPKPHTSAMLQPYTSH